MLSNIQFPICNSCGGKRLITSGMWVRGDKLVKERLCLTCLNSQTSEDPLYPSQEQIERIRRKLDELKDKEGESFQERLDEKRRGYGRSI